MKKLYPYQNKGIQDVINKFKQGSKRVVFQLATGGGKTITASELIYRFHVANPTKEIIFFVDSEELLEQFKKTFEKQFKGMEVGIISAGAKFKRIDLKIHVAMILTSVNRLTSNPNWFGNNVGLIIIDEAHGQTFDKIFKWFPNTHSIGLTATPMRLSKKFPMNAVYCDIVSSIAISELIERGSLSPNKSYAIKNDINFSKMKKTGGDFNSKSIFEEMSQSKHIRNVVTAYERISKGQKTLIFNSTVEHSEMVNRIFIEMGYNSKHLDGATNKEERKSILEWFNKTPDAILQNVGVLTKGFDEPSIITIIMNRPTVSLPLWLQCTGRGSRIYPNKQWFNIIDLGGNIKRLGDWSMEHDWETIFHTATVKSDDEAGIAPMKDCPMCYFMMSINTMLCPECGHQFKSKEIEEDNDPIELELVADLFSKKINVNKIDNFVKKNGFNDYAGLHMIKDVMLNQIKELNISKESRKFETLHDLYMKEVDKWCGLNGKKFNDWHKNFANQILNDKLN